ncbi:glycine betaine ABC transporter substrate-binding protein [Emcibacter sp. SYSU 3D8]|uniref:ABC transporter permease/substrate-binding protein n=1 Tax=Emcibacter sp. SYSU 3D8 TaxID=3133969 RepID=UPI0031FF2BEA
MLMLMLLVWPAQSWAVTVGSKAFTEGVILGEILTGALRDAGIDAAHRTGLGGTRIVYEALKGGDIDAYVDYTGTISGEIVAGRDASTAEAMRAALREDGIGMTGSLGFENTYAIAMRADRAQSLGIAALSDLRAHPGLKLVFSNEFLDRKDGWPLLRGRYRLPQSDVRGMEHELAYRALGSDAIHATDVYTTDANIPAYGLTVLRDDLAVFPEYQAVVLYRLDLPAGAIAALRQLEGRIDVARMQSMNADVTLRGKTERSVAAAFLQPGAPPSPDAAGFWRRLVRTTGAHLTLVGLSLGAAILVAVPLGILAYRRPRAGQVILAVAGVAQTIPSLALFVFMIPLVGIGGPPALIALFLYSLLPIVRNTHAGLHGIPASLRESAEALGLPRGVILRRIELPLATRSIMAGIKIAAVINVGTATLGALIGAGGYGQPILTGIRLADTGMILEGAVPAALLALATQGLFELLERRLVPRGLRLPPRATDA